MGCRVILSSKFRDKSKEVGKCHNKKSENFRNIRALLHAHAHELAFSIGPSAVLFYYPSEGVWVIVPPFPYPPGTAHCPTLPTFETWP